MSDEYPITPGLFHTEASVSDWRMRPFLKGGMSHPSVPPVELGAGTFNYELPTGQSNQPNMKELMRWHVEQLVILAANKPGRAAMILKELREAKLAPKARKRK